MRYRQFFAVAAFGVSSVINPGYFAGCASSGNESDADSDQAKAALMAEHVLVANDSYDLDIDTVTYRLDVDIEPVRAAAQQALNTVSAFAQTVYACGNHKLVASAAACIDTYEMDVTGTITLLRKGDGDNYTEVMRPVTVTGALHEVSGIANSTLSLRFSSGQVELKGETSTSFKLGAHTLQALIAQ